MIAVTDLGKRFGTQTALDGVTFGVAAGECFALLGPNGSGKTTVLKCLAGLVHRSSGELRIVREEVSYLPQSVVFPDYLTVMEVLEFYAKLRRLDPGRVETVLELLRCTGFRRRVVRDLSGGMRQRLAIAVACLPDSPVLLLDEPTASLDPQGAMEFRDLLTGFKRQGKTIVFSSHVLADVEQLADRVAILVSGKLLAVESAAALRAELRSRCRLRVVPERADAGCAGAALRAGGEDAQWDGESLAVRCAPDRRMAILQAIEGVAGVARFTTEEPSLEEVYLRYLDGNTMDGGVAGIFGGMPGAQPAAC